MISAQTYVLRAIKLVQYHALYVYKLSNDDLCELFIDVLLVVCLLQV